MSRKQTPFKQCLNKLQDLHKTYPNQSLGAHISVAMSDYKDIWGVSDKEFLYALEKYELEMENNVVSDKEVAKIIADAQDLSTLFDDEDDEEIDRY